MVFKNVELHNVYELEKHKEKDGYVCLRMPVAVRDQLEMGMSEMVSRSGKATEIRFVMLSDTVTIKFAKFDKSSNHLHSVNIFYGGIQGTWKDDHRYLNGEIDEITIEKPKNMSFLKAASNLYADVWNPEVVRVIFNGGYYVLLNIEGDVRPPYKEETPQKKLMTYGSSITHGSSAMDSSHAWANWLAHSLGMDLINHAMSGSCAMEPALVEFIAEQGEQGNWDMGILELGINVLNWEDSKITERVKNTITQIAGRNQDKPIYVISPLYCSNDFHEKNQAQKWRNIIKDTIDELNYKNVTYINGLDLIGDAKYLSADEVHPNIYGCQKIADDLLKIINN